MFGANGTAMIETAARVPPRIMAGRRPTVSVNRPAGPTAPGCATAAVANAMPVPVAGRGRGAREEQGGASPEGVGDPAGRADCDSLRHGGDSKCDAGPRGRPMQ